MLIAIEGFVNGLGHVLKLGRAQSQNGNGSTLHGNAQIDPAVVPHGVKAHPDILGRHKRLRYLTVPPRF